MTPADLAELLKIAAAAVLAEHDLDTAALPATVTVERPRNPEHGDYATNLALQLGKKVGVNPRELAGWLAAALADAEGIASAEVAGPGFVNLRLEASAQGVIINNVIDAGRNYGHSEALKGQKINLEFVSANPTGPIHIGGTRWAAVGDALGRLLSTQGAEVVREYYFNDHGAQIDRFTNSLIAAAKGEPTPEDGYAGSYIADIAAQVLAKEPDALSLPDDEMRETFRAIGVDLMFTHIKQSLHDFGTDFDVYTHEDSMHSSGPRRAGHRQAARDRQVSTRKMAQSGCAPPTLATTRTASSSRATVSPPTSPPTSPTTWTSASADSTCASTCSAPTITATSPGSRPSPPHSAGPATVEVLIGQMVNLVRDGQPVRMSKRAGTVITLDDLVEAIGVDAARYSLIRRRWTPRSTSTCSCGRRPLTKTRSTTCNTRTPGCRRWPATPQSWELSPSSQEQMLVGMHPPAEVEVGASMEGEALLTENTELEDRNCDGLHFTTQPHFGAAAR